MPGCRRGRRRSATPAAALERGVRRADRRARGDRAVNLLPVPRTLASEVAALVEPLACALHVLDVVDVADQTVAVLGPGPMGMLLCACLADAGARAVYITGGSNERRTLATEFGAVPGRRAGRGRRDRDDGHRRRLAGRHPGGPQGRHRRLLQRHPGQVDLSADRLHYDELTLKGAFHHTPRTVRAALAFLASAARPWEKLLTHEVSLEQLPGLFAEPPVGYLKAVVRI